MNFVIEEKVFYRFAFITKTQHKLNVSKSGIIFHDMPQNRISTNGNHRFRNIFCHVPDACAVSAAKYHYLHVFCFFAKISILSVFHSSFLINCTFFKLSLHPNIRNCLNFARQNNYSYFTKKNKIVSEKQFTMYLKNLNIIFVENLNSFLA